MYGEHGEIPYEEIDCEIRRLVWLINAFPGIRTLSSCAGHTLDNSDTEIVFKGETSQAVYNLLTAMPFWGIRGGFVNNQPHMRTIWASVIPDSGQLLYSLRIGGSPTHVQRALVGDIEELLAKKVTSIRGTHPPYSTCAARDNHDM